MGSGKRYDLINNPSKVNLKIRSKNDLKAALLEGMMQYHESIKLIKDEKDDVGKIMAAKKLDSYGFGEWEIKSLIECEN